MHLQTISTISIVEALILSILAIIFCVLALFILVHYIRRRYKLYKEINRIPQELLSMESYRNHLKNLKITCIINNFIIVMLVLEILQNLGEIFVYFPPVITYFVKEPGFNFGYLLEIEKIFFLIYMPIYYSFVPVLSMLMDFLLLTYRKYEYKFTIIKWTWYIVIRILVAFLFQSSSNYIIFPLRFKIMFYNLVCIVYGIVSIIDLIQFVYYARKFYLHLKSREKEIRLFYFDKKAYLDSKYLRIHFKIATILVGIAFFFSTLSKSVGLFTLFSYAQYYITIPQQLNHFILFVTNSNVVFVANPSFIILKVLFIFNYLYIFIVVVYKSYRDGQKLKNINDYIKPIMKQYHDNYYNRYTNYA